MNFVYRLSSLLEVDKVGGATCSSFCDESCPLIISIIIAVPIYAISLQFSCAADFFMNVSCIPLDEYVALPATGQDVPIS